MEEVQLDVQVRKEVGTQKARGVRRENFVPGIVYGAERKKATPIKVDRKVFEHIRRVKQGSNIIFHLNVFDGDKKLQDCPVIVKEEQHDPVNEQILHVDFNEISLKKKIEVNVPVVTKGDAPGIKAGGSIEHILWELHIVCLPTQIPQQIEVDVSNLNIGDNIHMKDIVLPEGIVAKHDPEAIVITVAAPMKEEVAPAAAAAAEGEGVKAEPEVIKEKKPEAGEKKEGAEKAEKAEKPEKKEEKK